jgi:hypothetical protein
MKKVFCGIIMLLIMATTCFAQHAGTIGVGLWGSVGFGFYNKSSVDANWNTSGLLAAAFFGSYTFIDNLSVRLELGFSDQGLPTPVDNRYKGSFVVDTIDIPVLVKYAFLDSPFLLGAFAGAQLSIPVYIKSLADYLDPLPSDNALFGLVAGIFADYPLRIGPVNGNIIADLRFLFDFNTVKATAKGVAQDILPRRILSFRLGYEFIF